MPDHPVWPEAELREIAAGLSPAMRHVLLRCSEYTDWSARHEYGIARQWIDLVAGRDRCSIVQVRALVRRDLLVETRYGYAATLLGIAVRGRLIREGFRP